MYTTEKTIALLIDAENINHHHAETILKTLAPLGKLIIKRIYGNWAKSHLASWTSPITRYGLKAIQQFDHLSGKNASDIAICIDAMEIMLCKEIDIFCLVTSDSDFTPLCLKLHEYNKHVIGMGNQNAAKSLVGACHEFIYLNKQTTPPPALTKAPVLTRAAYGRGNPNQDSQLLALIKETYQTKAQDGRLSVAHLGSVLHQNQYSDVVQRYGLNTLSDLINALSDYEAFNVGSTAVMQLRAPKIVAAPFNQQDTQEVSAFDKQSTEALIQDSRLNNAISNAIAIYQDADGWAAVGKIAIYVRDQFGILPENYGYRNFSDILENLLNFELKKQRKDGLRYDLVKDVRTQHDTKPQHISHTATNAHKSLAADKQKIIDAINHILSEKQDKDGWVMLSTVGSDLRELGISAKHYGYKNAGVMIKDLGEFDSKVIHSTAYLKNPKLKRKPVSPLPSIETDASPKQPDSHHATDSNAAQNDEYTSQDAITPKANTAQDSITPADEFLADNALADERLAADESANDAAATDDKFTLSDLLALIHDAMHSHQNPDGYTKVGDIGKYVRKTIGMGAQSFGFADFGKLLDTLGGYEIMRQGRHMMVKTPDDISGP